MWYRRISRKFASWIVCDSSWNIDSDACQLSDTHQIKTFQSIQSSCFLRPEIASLGNQRLARVVTLLPHRNSRRRLTCIVINNLATVHFSRSGKHSSCFVQDGEGEPSHAGELLQMLERCSEEQTKLQSLCQSSRRYWISGQNQHQCVWTDATP